MQNLFPKIIWLYWEQGINSIIPFGITCLKSWIYKNQDWKINILDKNNIHNFIDVFSVNNDFFNIEPIQIRADIIRCLLLQKYGGIWVDITLFCNTPLNDWFFNSLNNQDFFVFLYPNFTISNWFLASLPNSYIINTFNNKFVNYFNKNIIVMKYFQFHDFFNSMLKNDSYFFNNFNKIKKINAKNARLTYFYKNHVNNKNFNKNILIKYYSPVYKFSTKINYSYFNKYTNALKNSIPLNNNIINNTNIDDNIFNFIFINNNIINNISNKNNIQNNIIKNKNNNNKKNIKLFINHKYKR
jgi:mannosyltransferase OCH1-like enzyme